MLFTLSACLALALVKGQEFSCPKDDNLICLDGLHGDPYDCTKYHHCLDCQYATLYCEDGLHFDDYLKYCRDPYLAECDEVNYPRNGSAFCVTRSSGRVDGPMNPLVFNEFLVNYRAPYDYETGYWRASHQGYYFFHLAAGTYPSQRVNVSFGGTPFPFNTVRNSTVHDYDQISRDMIMDLNQYSVLAMILDDQTSINSDAGRQTMWAGFNLEEFMGQVVTFFATSNVYQPAFTPELAINFEEEMIDTHNAFTPSGGVFTAPVSGTYFFMFSSGSEAYGEHRSQFRSSRTVESLSELYRALGVNNGLDTLSKSLIYYLDVGQTMQVFLVAGSASNNQSTLLSFGGFLYDPEPPTPQFAWFVTTQSTQYGPADPLVFETIKTSIGSPFNPTTNSVQIYTSGFYYMSFYAGLTRVDTLDVQLISQTGTGTPVLIADINRSSSYNTYEDTIGRGVMVHLKAGDEVRIRINGVSAAYSDVSEQTIFSGFLLLAIENP